MNLNVKLDGETEEQSIQYVNRFAINIPPTAFNLNIVNPNLNNQGYILNPVNPVPQNIVAYQPSMAVQSYFTLPAESEGNVLHSLPVGVSVPVGLPVQTGFLQNNFVNTSIIIGNENCNSQDLLNASPNRADREDDLKSAYLEKPIEEFIGASEAQNIGLNCSPGLTVENAVKKPCPLEMSIKAANIDIEFEKCEQEIPILVTDGLHLATSDKLTAENMPDSGTEALHMSLGESQMPASLTDVINFEDDTSKLKNTEITWDEGTIKPTMTVNNFQESLICEVEEVNDDEDENNAEDEEGEDDDDDDDDDEEDGEEEEEEEDEEEECEAKKGGKENAAGNVENRKNAYSEESSEESDGLPLSVALKLKKPPDEKGGKGRKEENVPGKTSASSKSIGKRTRKSAGDSEGGEEWSDSDDDVLNLKRIRNEFDYKCYFEPKATTKREEGPTKFARVRSCCSKKECSKKIPVKDQRTAHRHFYDLETNGRRDLYLATCVEHVQKGGRNTLKTVEDGTGTRTGTGTGLSATNIQLEIQNESKGNQKISDEIQKAINESLKDCGVELGEKSGGTECDREEKNNWNYFIVVGGTKRKVCLQFLLKLLRITKSRIKQLQKKLLSGTPLIDEPEQKLDEVWTLAKSHLDSIGNEEISNCTGIPRHHSLLKNYTREELFADFREFYKERTGKEPICKYSAYKRFLDRETNLSFLPKGNEGCGECEYMKRRKKAGKGSRDNNNRTKGNFDSEEEEPMNPKKIKLTIPLKGISNSGKVTRDTADSQGRRKSAEKKGTKTRGQQSRDRGRQTSAPSRGRDVWSLMLLHLETLPYKECNSCTNKKKHRFFNSTFTTQGLFEDYRKYFLKETNSELGLGFVMYEKYFNRNCNYSIMDINEETRRCPRCISDQLRS